MDPAKRGGDEFVDYSDTLLLRLSAKQFQMMSNVEI